MNEIEVIECDTIGEAELEYQSRREQGCWQMVKAVKPVFSWKKMKTVFRFEMKKLEKAYHFEDYMRDMNKAIKLSCEVAGNLFHTTAGIKAKRKLQQLNIKTTNG
jgi:hypothetical protein